MESAKDDVGAGLSREHAHVLRELSRTVTDTVAPLREEVRVGFARLEERHSGLAARVEQNQDHAREALDRLARLEGHVSAPLAGAAVVRGEPPPDQTAIRLRLNSDQVDGMLTTLRRWGLVILLLMAGAGGGVGLDLSGILGLHP